MTRASGKRDRTTTLLDVLHVVVAATIGLSSWWPLFRAARSIEPSIVAVHRTAGDIQYQPLIYALAHFNVGDTSVLENHGAGIASFPLAAILGHALSVGLFGTYGWAVADVGVSIAYFLLGRLLLVRIGLPPRWASLASIGLLLGCFFDEFAFLFARGIPFGPFPSATMAAPLSAFRIPRPFVTEIFAVFAATSLLALVLPGVPRSPKLLRRDAIVAGVALAALVQADIYAAAAVLPVFTLVAAGRLAWEVADPKRRALGLRRAMLLGVTAVVLLAPFVVQRLFEHPDIPRRFGAYRVPRSSASLSTEALHQVEAALLGAVVLAGAVFVRPAWRTGPARRTLLALACLFALAAGSAVAKPLFVVATGKMVQEYHFDQQFAARCGLACACLGVMGVWFFGRALARRARLAVRPSLRASRWIERGTAALCTVLVCVWAFRHASTDYRQRMSGSHVRSDFFHYRELGGSYLRDFRQLTKELSARSGSGLRVLATLDHELAVWWIAFEGGSVLNPDPFVTPLPDAEIERRLVAFGAAMELDPDGFVRFVLQDEDRERNNSLGNNNIVVNLFLSHQKYGGASGWHLKVPSAERKRLKQLYREEARRDAYRIDGVVLFARGVLSDLTPDPARFVLAFENPTFRLYVRR